MLDLHHLKPGIMMLMVMAMNPRTGPWRELGCFPIGGKSTHTHLMNWLCLLSFAVQVSRRSQYITNSPAQGWFIKTATPSRCWQPVQWTSHQTRTFTLPNFHSWARRTRECWVTQLHTLGIPFIIHIPWCITPPLIAAVILASAFPFVIFPITTTNRF